MKKLYYVLFIALLLAPIKLMAGSDDNFDASADHILVFVQLILLFIGIPLFVVWGVYRLYFLFFD